MQRKLRVARDERPRAEQSAGAFMGPDIMVPVPMGMLGADRPTAGEDGDENAARRQPRRGWLQRLVDRLTMRPRA